MSEDEQSPRPVSVEATKPTEFDEGVAEYGKILGSCFDENGKFKEKLERTGKYTYNEVWLGEHVLSTLLHEPEATNFQEVVLGVRPLTFIDGGSLPLLSQPAEFRDFLQETSGDIGAYVHKPEDVKNAFHLNFAIYNKNKVLEVINNNPDVFGEYRTGESIDAYLKKGLRWSGLSNLHKQNPIEALTLVNEGLTDENWEGAKDLTLFGETTFVDQYWSPSLAKSNAMKLGLLFGYPRDEIESAIADKFQGMRLRKKIIRNHNNLMKTSPEYKKGFAQMSENEFDSGIHRQNTTIVVDFGLTGDNKLDLTDEDKEYIEKHREPEHNEHSYFMDRFYLTREKPTNLRQVDDKMDDVVKKSGIKQTQREIATKYLALKSENRFTRKLKSMILGSKPRIVLPPEV